MLAVNSRRIVFLPDSKMSGRSFSDSARSDNAELEKGIACLSPTPPVEV